MNKFTPYKWLFYTRRKNDHKQWSKIHLELGAKMTINNGQKYTYYIYKTINNKIKTILS